MCVGEPCVNARARLILKQRTRCDAAEMSEVSCQSRVRDTALFISLQITKEEDAVTANRPAERKAELSPLKERIRISWIAIQRRIRRKLVIAKIVKRSAMKI